MESEKVKEIKKALECCSSTTCTSDCPLSGYHANNYKTMCRDKLVKDCLTLINELESENERWQEKEGALSCDLEIIREKLTNAEIEVSDYQDKMIELNSEIAELEKEKTCEYIECRDNDWTYWECSNCEEPFYFSNDASPEENQYHYCPNCGARITAYKELDET